MKLTRMLISAIILSAAVGNVLQAVPAATAGQISIKQINDAFV